MINAINAKYQKTINKWFKLDRQYHDLVNQDLDCTVKSCKIFTRAFELFESLPKREQKNINKQYKSLFGYEV